jgi:hypothetical protein
MFSNCNYFDNVTLTMFLSFGLAQSRPTGTSSVNEMIRN